MTFLVIGKLYETNVMISFKLISKTNERVKHNIGAIFLVELSYLFDSEWKMRNACLYENWTKSCPDKYVHFR